MRQPRGIRNNNPGNIERNKITWKGMSIDQLDNRFVSFDDPVFGIRAIAKLLLRYQRAYNIRTPAAIIGRWAPPHENNTDAYSARFASEVGVGVNEQINLENPEIMRRAVVAIIKHENGMQPYSDAQIAEGVRMAFQ